MSSRNTSRASLFFFFFFFFFFLFLPLLNLSRSLLPQAAWSARQTTRACENMGSMGSEPLSGPSARRRILFIDAYDSFSNNITSLLATLLDVDVFVLPIDTPITEGVFREELRHYDAVVCGPGPGSPENKSDVGLMRWLWELQHDDLVPVLGVCLGFQSLVLACGGRVRRLRRGLHGMVRAIEHRGAAGNKGGDIFEGVGTFRATLYHSLCADVGQDAVADWEGEKWECCPSDVVPLAWVEEERGGEDDDADDDDARERPERILMAMRHRRKPFWGVQYHPESVCTEEEGDQVVRNWFCKALRWNLEHGRATTSPVRGAGSMIARNAVRTSLLQQVVSRAEESSRGGAGRDAWAALLLGSPGRQLFARESLPLRPCVEVPDIAEALDAANTNHIILDSANGDQLPPDAGVDVRGRFSIIAVDVDECLRVEHHAGEDFVTVVDGPARGTRYQVPLPRGQTVWHLLAEFHESRRTGLETTSACGLPDEDEVPFLGGFVGFVTYEQGLHDIDVQLPQDRGHGRPDVCLAWVTRSVIVDHRTGVLHVQDLESGGSTSWVASAVRKLQDAAIWRDDYQSGFDDPHDPRLDERPPVVRMPERAKYEAKVRMCQEYIGAGESYELCLTDQTDITRPLRAPQQQASANGTKMKTDAELARAHSSWQLYRALRRRNPAPFASYLRLGGATLVSSSPERFLAHDRAGACSMKPMKGTVKKSSPSSLPGDGCATLAEAEAILHVPKEEAENLMIVDLVRHDLHGVCGAGAVRVPELLKVEEYQTVYTMITRVEGQLPAPVPVPAAVAAAGEESKYNYSSYNHYSGLDVLAAGLPPGSMTGAPKKRSCEILRRVEAGRERSLYSGVVGYMCVTGRGDWSVTIRSMFRWDDECDNGGGAEGEEGEEVWHIGAGGAVTILSTPEGEREEMFVKLARPLSVFAAA